MKAELRETVALPEGVTASISDGALAINGPKGSVIRVVRRPNIKASVEPGNVVFYAPIATQREKRHIYTLKSHANNAVRGVTEGHTYKVKVCSGHFPMNISIKDGSLTVKNFLGESVPRRLKLKSDVEVKLDGDLITITSHNKDLAGHQASDIEQLTRISNRDRRIFQDGLYIIEKDGRSLL